jgi:hypothetical protein
MSELDDAIVQLQQAVTRLEAASQAEPSEPDPRVSEIAAALAARVDTALARIGRVLAGEG